MPVETCLTRPSPRWGWRACMMWKNSSVAARHVSSMAFHVIALCETQCVFYRGSICRLHSVSSCRQAKAAKFRHNWGHMILMQHWEEFCVGIFKSFNQIQRFPGLLLCWSWCNLHYLYMHSVFFLLADHGLMQHWPNAISIGLLAYRSTLYHYWDWALVFCTFPSFCFLPSSVSTPKPRHAQPLCTPTLNLACVCVSQWMSTLPQHWVDFWLCSRLLIGYCT